MYMGYIRTELEVVEKLVELAEFDGNMSAVKYWYNQIRALRERICRGGYEVEAEDDE